MTFLAVKNADESQLEGPYKIYQDMHNIVTMLLQQLKLKRKVHALVALIPSATDIQLDRAALAVLLYS